MKCICFWMLLYQYSIYAPTKASISTIDLHQKKLKAHHSVMSSVCSTEDGEHALLKQLEFLLLFQILCE